MTLGEALADVRLKRPLAPKLAGAVITGLDYDSRRVQPGFLFFAFPGSRADGRAFAQDALARGAVAVASESELPEPLAARWVRVEHGRHALALAARNFYGKPDERIGLTGITGTNGKTTTGFLIDSVLRAAGANDRADRDHRVPPCGARAAGREHHAGIARPGADLRRAGWAGRSPRHHGSLLARAGAGPRVWAALPHRGVHQPDARPPGFPRHDGGVLRGQADAVRWRRRSGAAVRRAESRRSDTRGRIATPPATQALWYGLGPECGPARAAHLLGVSGPALRGAARQAALRGGIAADRQDQRVQHPGGVRRGALVRHRAGAPSRAASPACGPCRAGSSAWTKASRSWWWWTTRIPTTRCAT